MDKIQYISSDFLAPKDAWDRLPMSKKTEIMRVAVNNGITNLSDIRKEYNEFAKGGNISDEESRSSNQMVTTGGTGYLPDNYGQGSIDAIRRRLYRNITPFGYHNPISRTLGAIALNQQDDTRTEENKRIKDSVPEASALDAIWATYLSIPENQRRNINSKYGISKTKDGYYRLNSPGMIFNFEQDLSPHGLFGLPGRKAVMMNGILGNYTTGLGRDTKGDYIFYSDSRLNPDGTPNTKTGWDINPYSNTVDASTEETTEKHGQYGQDKKDLSYKIGKALFENVEDISMGVGTPVPIYDKIYLDDYYGLSKEQQGGHYLPEITVYGSKHSIGGPIIKKTKGNHNFFKEGGSVVDDSLVDLIIKEEGFNTKPEDIGDGKITLGSGLTNSRWHDLYRRRGNVWSEADNRHAVRTEAAEREQWAKANVPNWGSLPDSAKKALLLYKYNFDFTRGNSPKLFAALEAGNLQEAAKQMDATSKDPKFRKGLADRRRREQALFLSEVPVAGVAPRDITIQSPVNTYIQNPYTVQQQNTVQLPQYVPAQDEYVRTVELSPEQQRAIQLKERFDQINRFNQIMKLVGIENTALPAFMPESGITALDAIWTNRNTKERKHEDGGPIVRMAKHYYDGMSESTQQVETNSPNIYRRPNGEYFYQANPSSEEIAVRPITTTVFDNPALWTYTDDAGRYYTPKISDKEAITETASHGPIIDAANNYFREMQYRTNDGSLLLQGKYMWPLAALAATGIGSVIDAPFATAASMVEGGIGNYVTNKLSSAFTGNDWATNVSDWTGLDKPIAAFTNPGMIIGGQAGYSGGKTVARGVAQDKALATEHTPYMAELYNKIYKGDISELQKQTPWRALTKGSPNLGNEYGIFDYNNPLWHPMKDKTAFVSELMNYTLPFAGPVKTLAKPAIANYMSESSSPERVLDDVFSLKDVGTLIKPFIKRGNYNGLVDSELGFPTDVAKEYPGINFIDYYLWRGDPILKWSPSVRTTARYFKENPAPFETSFGKRYDLYNNVTQGKMPSKSAETLEKEIAEELSKKYPIPQVRTKDAEGITKEGIENTDKLYRVMHRGAPLETNKWIGLEGSYNPELPELNIAGHQIFIDGDNGTLLSRDIWKFNPWDWRVKWGEFGGNTAQAGILDKLGNPFITTSESKIKPDALLLLKSK